MLQRVQILILQFLTNYLRLVLIVAICFGFLGTFNDAEADAIGIVAVQEGVTSVKRKGEESDLTKNSDIMFMDNVKTGKGELGITFIDDTVVAVSSQSSLIIDDFVYDPNSSGSKLILKVASGTVRYASGNIAKLNNQNVDIRTPTARIGVRGTAFSMTVDEIGQSLIILLPNVDGTVGEISVESDVGIVLLNVAFQATSVRSRMTSPSKPKVMDLTENQINNMLIVKPPKEKVDIATAREDDKKKKGVLGNLLDGEKEIDKNLLDEPVDEGFTSLDVNPLDINLLLNILEQLNKKYERMNILTNAKKTAKTSNRDGLVSGYNEDTLVTTLIAGDDVQLIREYEGSIVDITLDQGQGAHTVNIDQYGNTVPEIITNETSSSSTINVTIK